LQLHQAISQANDPSGMLEHVASQNQMFPLVLAETHTVTILAFWLSLALAIWVDVVSCFTRSPEIYLDGLPSLTLTTLKNAGFFDGQIHIQVKRLLDHNRMLLVQVLLAVPKGGHRISKRMG
jgi:hypothetical protein